MFYVLFQYKKGKKESGFQRFRSLSEVEEFLWKNGRDFGFFKIIEVKKEYTAKCVLIPVDDTLKKPSARGRPKKGKGKKEEKEKAETEKLDKEESSKEEIEIDEKPEETEEDIKRKDEELMKKSDKAMETAKKEKKMGRCKRKSCLKVFELEDWQHSTLHWCPECQRRPDYKGYDKNWRKSHG